jgi:hypothetical protein
MPDETTIEPSYERIPRDADGNPVFLILSDSDQKRYDRIMKSCEGGLAGYERSLVLCRSSDNYADLPSDLARLAG